MPEDALWHAGYAELLGYYAEFAGYEGVDTLALKIKALQEIHRALELAPEDETVKEIAYGLTWLLDGGIMEVEEGFDFPWLTATPLPTDVFIEPAIPGSTITPTVTVYVTEVDESATVVTAKPEVTPTAEPVAHGVNAPLCGSAILLPFILLFGVKMGHNRSRKPSP